MLDGRSGAGKTSLLRVLAGLTAPEGGSVQITASTLFLPQKPYLPQGSLKNLLCYPALPTQPENELRAVLEQVGLAQLAPELATQADWQTRLSGGE